RRHLSEYIHPCCRCLRIALRYKRIRLPPKLTLFPYTTLFRSVREGKIQALISPLVSFVLMLLLEVIIGYGGMRVSSGALSAGDLDRKSTRLNSSHVSSSYAVFCLKHKTGQISAIIETKGCHRL